MHIDEAEKKVLHLELLKSLVITLLNTFDVTAREHLNDGFNAGVYNSGDTSTDGNEAQEGKLAIEVWFWLHMLEVTETEFITPQYVDVDKPRDFDSRQNGIINFNLGNFVKVYDVYGSRSFW